MTCPEKQRANSLTDKDLEILRKEYENASDEERRALEIRDLGYPLTNTDAETETLVRIVPNNRYYVPE